MVSIWNMLPKCYWDCVIFSDESKFCLNNSGGRSFVWRKPHSQLDSKHINPTVKFGGGSIMVWGCFSSKGFGKLVLIDGIMYKYQYVSIWANNLQGSVNIFNFDRYIFQQDNDPKHTSFHTKEFINRNMIELLNWPAQSPDLNPIENVWADIKRKLSGKVFKYKNDLWEAIKEIWEGYDVGYAVNLINSMKSRVLECLRCNGGHISY